MRASVVRSLTGFVLLASMVGCSDLATPPGAYEFVGQPIYNGSPPDDSRYDAVVGIYIHRGGQTYICTGTLISADVVLTAAHCLDVASGGRTYQTASPSQLEVFFGNQISGNGRAVAQALIHSGYNRRQYGVNDLGLMRLQAPVASSTAVPMPWLPASLASSETAGTVVNFAGFGQTETGQLGIKLQVDGTLSQVRSTQLEYPQPLAVGGPCSGDSGGPLIYDFDGAWYLGGTTSYGDAQCTQYGVSMRVSAYDGWISDFVGVPDCSVDAECDDLNGCTNDACVGGACVNTTVDCGDGDACTTDSCVAGSCVHGSVNCNDGNACTDDACNSATGCTHANNTVACNDGDACTGPDACAGGTCTGNPINTPACTCRPKNATCSSDADCCSGNCHNNGRCR